MIRRASLFVTVALSACGGDNGSGPAAEVYRLSFVGEPAIVEAKEPITPALRVVVTLNGAPAPQVNGQVSVTLVGDPTEGDATLRGTTTVSTLQGVATFTDLTLDRLGEGFQLRASFAGGPSDVTVPDASGTPFEVRLTLQELVAAGQHTCGRSSAGHTFCWGRNYDGEVGDSTPPATNPFAQRPVPVAGGLRFDDLSAGANHTCGLTASGEAYCWGQNGGGALGDGSQETRAWPVAVSGAHTFVQLSAGGGHTCGITSGGETLCWGENGFGELGDGTTGTNRSTPTMVASGLTFSEVRAGNTHTCGLTSSQEAYCWGDNGVGQLGDGTTTPSSTPVPVSGGILFSHLSLGGIFTCALDAEGAAYCWGANGTGQLGTGTSNTSTPQEVLGDLRFDELSAGGLHSCAVDPAGRAYCWGSDDRGELGLGGALRPIPSEPALVTGGHEFTGISASSGSHSCAVTPAGLGYCWGSNTARQISADLESTSTDEPVIVGR